MLAVYTAVFGGIGDRLYAAPEVPGVVYYAFVDSPRTWNCAQWQLLPPAFRCGDPRRQARQHKLLSHWLFPDAEYSVWVDGAMTPAVSPRRLVAKYLQEHDLATFRHSRRDCIYLEMAACVSLKKDDYATMRDQVDHYRRQGYPPHNGLVETGVLLRRHTPAIRDFNEAWWAEVENHSVRDQLSFNYVCRQLGTTYRELDGTIFTSKEFRLRHHWGKQTRCPHACAS